MQPRGPEAKGPWAAAPTLEGSRWFPQLLAPQRALSSAPGPQWAPRGLPSMGATCAPGLCCDVSPTVMSIVHVHPGGQRGPLEMGNEGFSRGM